MSGLDVIGDIHGYAGHLRRLLAVLGYDETEGVYRHRQGQRQVVFLGDLIDRGPNQIEVLTIVRRMVEAGTAKIVMGNHEFNAIAYATPHPTRGWCRRHTPKNFHQHESFLDAVGWHSTPLHREWIGPQEIARDIFQQQVEQTSAVSFDLEDVEVRFQ